MAGTPVFRLGLHVGAAPSYYPAGWGAGNQMVVTVNPSGAFDYNLNLPLPAVELPPNCTVRVTVLPNPEAAAAIVWHGVYLRWRYGQLGSLPASVADAPLLTPTDGGDGADQVG